MEVDKDNSKIFFQSEKIHFFHTVFWQITVEEFVKFEENSYTSKEGMSTDIKLVVTHEECAGIYCLKLFLKARQKSRIVKNT